MTFILGISGFYHDSAAALIADGDIVAAAQEERFTRIKYDSQLPVNAVEFCLREAGIRPERLDYVAFYDQPLTKFERLIETYVAYAPAGFASFRRAIPVWLKQKLHVRREIRRALRGYSKHVLFIDHHESHASSAFFPSPFDEAATLTLDGVGEWSTTTIGRGQGNKLQLLEQIRFPHSLGLLYSAFTYYCGLTVNSGEYKLMGLAPYGKPIFTDAIYRHLIDVKSDGSYHMDMSYFRYCSGLTMTGPKFEALFGGPPRKPDERITERHMDLAASVQRVTEEVTLRIASHAWERTGRPRNLVLAGGVALNCVANGRLLREGPFERIWIQPAAGDAGGALGAALFTWHHLLDRPRAPRPGDSQKGSQLGPRYEMPDIERVLEAAGARYERFDDEDALLEHAATDIAGGQVVGWFHGRSEFGPRALGCRSILGDPRNPRLQSMLNLKVKFRESFRPFAPSVLREHAHEWFSLQPDEDSPYMLLVAPVLERHRTPLSEEDRQALATDPNLSRRVNVVRSRVPAITHVDYSARIQTVDERHGRFFRLMKRFHERTGCPIFVNTSFNLSWEPIVETPLDAYRTFMQSQMDMLVLENCVLRKADQPLGLTLWATRADETPAATPWADPRTGDPLIVTAGGASNSKTRALYQVDDGILRLFVAEDEEAHDGPDGARGGQQFQEKTLFSEYDDFDTLRSLIEKSRAELFTRLLNEQIPYHARVAEVGCGSGQLTNFLAIAQRTVAGVDSNIDALRVAQRFKIAHQLERAAFAHVNLLQPGLREDFFDFVISLGVLDRTSHPREVFGRIARLVRSDGYFVIGLSKRRSRILQAGRQALARFAGNRRWQGDRRLGGLGDQEQRGQSWVRDRTSHPRESTHTLEQVLRWIEQDGFRFINMIPKPGFGDRLRVGDALFNPQPCRTRAERFLAQTGDWVNEGPEGGHVIVIAQRTDRVE